MQTCGPRKVESVKASGRMSLYVVNAILRTRLALGHLSPRHVAQDLRLTCFEKKPVNSLLLWDKLAPDEPTAGKRLPFLDF